MSETVRRRYTGRTVFDDAGNPCAEIETVVYRLCACTCGNRWHAEAGTKTRCDGGFAKFYCPVSSRTFEVPA